MSTSKPRTRITSAKVALKPDSRTLEPIILKPAGRIIGTVTDYDDRPCRSRG